MGYSLRGRVLAGAALLALGGAAAGACSSSSGQTVGAAGEGGADSASGGHCNRSPECPGALLCDDRHRCVECLTSANCASGDRCLAGTCRAGAGDAGSPGIGNGGAAPVADAGAGGNDSAGGSLNPMTGGVPSQGDAGMPGEGGTGPLSGNCKSEPINPCSGIPHFTGTQTVDGDASDFCDIAPFTLALATSTYYRSPKAPVSSTTQATFRVGWSALALHVFIDVEDHSVHPNLSGSLLNVWNGDNVEVYASPLTPAGLFNATRSAESGAFQVIAAPPNPAGLGIIPSGQAAFTSTGQAYAVPAAQYKISLTGNGYSVEAQIPWTTAAPTAGANMGFDAGLSDDVDGIANINASYRDYYALLYNVSYVGHCTADYEPYCDSRNWCAPKALP